MEDSFSIGCIKKINCIADVADIKYKKTKYSKTCLSIPPTTYKLYNNNKNTTTAVKNFAQSAKALGMSSRRSVTNGKAAQHAAISTPVLSNADSGATGNYIRLADMNVLRDVRVSAPEEQIAVAVADGNLIHSSHHGFLDVPGHGAMIAYVFPQLRGSLLSISKLINFGLKVLYCSDFVTGFDRHDKPVFQGNRDVKTGLWMVDLRSLSTADTEGSIQAASESSACAAIRLDSAADFVNFWHATFGSPAVSTFIAAIDKGFIRVPGLTAAKVRRHTPNSLMVTCMPQDRVSSR